MARLTYTAAGAARALDLASDLVVVGSDASCHVILGGPEVAPIHCEIRRGNEGWRVVDLESRTGTRVNGDFVNTRVLRDGDVIDVGGVFLSFRDDPRPAASAPAPAAPKASAPRAAVPKAAPSRAARKQRPARRGAARDARAADDAGEEPEVQEVPRRNDRASTAFLVVGGVLGVMLLAWLLFRASFSETTNDHLRSQMVEAERKLEWQRVLDLAAQARDDGSYDYTQIREAAERARLALANAEGGERVVESVREWGQIHNWRMDNPKSDEEFVRKIDEFLTAYAGIDSVATRDAKAARTKVAGTSAVAGAAPGADAGWSVLQDDLKALELDGRFGEAVAKIEQWWDAHRNSVPDRADEVAAEKVRVGEAAEKWFQRQVLMARHWWEQGEKKKAQKTLDQAASKIGLPGYDDRAMEAYRELGK